MTKQVINLHGMEISLDDIMIMYDNFKNMMGHVSKKFLEPIKLNQKIIVDIDESHAKDYMGDMSLVNDMLKDKGEDELIRMLFQAWLVAKVDFVSVLKSVILNTDVGDNRVDLHRIVMPFDGVDPMFRYDNQTKKIYLLLNSDLMKFKKETALCYSSSYKGEEKGHKEYKEDSDALISKYGDFGKADMKKWIDFYKADWACDPDDHFMCPDELVLQYHLADLGEWLYDYGKSKENKNKPYYKTM